MTTYNSLTVEDLVVKRLWVEHKRIDTINLGSLVVSDPLYNVGIGTDNPEVRLDIIGTSAIRLPVGNNEIERPDMSTITNKDGIFRYNSSDKTYETYFLNKWRSLGGSQLELSTESGVSKSTIVLNKQGLTNSSEAGTSIEFRLEDSSNPDTLHQKQAKILVKNGGASNTGNIHFQTANGSDTYNDRIVIKKNGDVGVGTNHPIGKLHLEVSAQYEEGFYISNAHATYGSDSDGGVYHFNHYNSVNTSSRGLILQERNTTNVWKRNIMTWQRGTGNIGIDMLTPNSKLHIFESNANNKTLLIVQKGAATYGNSASGPAIEFKTFLTSSQASKNQSRIRGIDDVVGNGDYGGLAFDYRKGFSSYTEGFRLSSSGYIGVNRSDPKVILDIDDTGAIQLPIGTSDHRESLNDIVRKGMVRYNTTTDQFEGYGAGNAWGSLGGVKDIDQDTFITVSDGITDTDEIKFFAGNTSTEKMIIKPSGSVGIGTTSPHSTLQIQRGDSLSGSALYNEDKYALILYSNDYSGGTGNNATANGIFAVSHTDRTAYMTMNYQGLFKRGTGKMEIFNRTNNEIQFGTNNVERMRIDSNGRVGIDTTSPDQKLEIKEGNIKITQHHSDDTIRSIMWENALYNRTLYVAAETHGGTHERHLYLGYTEDSTINNSSYTNGAIVTVRADGKVGIGENAPVEKLDVNGNIRFEYKIKNRAGQHMYIDSTNYIYFQRSGSTKMTLDDSGRLGIGGTSTGSGLFVNYGGNGILIDQHAQIKHESNKAYYGLVFKNPGSNHTKYMGYSYGGGFTIGEYNPDHNSFTDMLTLYNNNIELAGDIHAAGDIYSGDDIFVGGQIIVDNTINMNSNQIWRPDGGTVYIQHNTPGGDLQLCNGGGNVGIDTYSSAPGAKLDVNGNIRLKNWNNQIIIHDNNWGLKCTESGSAYWTDIRMYGYNKTDRGFRVHNTHDNTYPFTVSGIGNVGIGKTSASTNSTVALRVQSKTRCNGQGCFEFLDEDGGVILAGRSYGTSYETNDSGHQSAGTGIRIGHHGSNYHLTGYFEVEGHSNSESYYYRTDWHAFDGSKICKLQLWRDVHTNSSWAGSMQFEVWWVGAGWGSTNGFAYIVKHHRWKSNNFIGQISNNYQNSDLRLWLRGNRNYYWQGENCYLRSAYIGSAGSYGGGHYISSASTIGGSSGWSTSTSSDNRIKHNEKNVGNALETISKLQAKTYIKTQNFYEKDHCFEISENGEYLDESGNNIKDTIQHFTETGFIAQEVIKIEELKHTVEGTDDEITEYGPSGEEIKYPSHVMGLRYNDIFCYNVQATKELYNLVKKEKDRLDMVEFGNEMMKQNIVPELKKENKILKQKLSILEKRQLATEKLIKDLIEKNSLVT